MSQYVLLRIQSLQEELESLKKIVSHQLLQSQRKTTYIKGLWKDFEINDDNFALLIRVKRYKKKGENVLKIDQ